MFHLGQMVVCVDDVPRCGPAWYPVQRVAVSKGMVYTIREIVPASQFVAKMPGLLLEEIVRLPWPGERHEPAFDARRFRPVKNTDISVLRDAVEKITNGALARQSVAPIAFDPVENIADEPAKAAPAIKVRARLSSHGSDHAGSEPCRHRTRSSTP